LFFIVVHIFAPRRCECT